MVWRLFSPAAFVLWIIHAAASALSAFERPDGRKSNPLRIERS